MAVSATDNTVKVVISENGGQGLPGADGSDGQGFNQVRKQLLDNPLCHLFKTNDLATVSAPLNTDADVTWARSTTATYVDRYGVVKTAAIDEPREEKEGFLIEGASTNLALYSEQFDNAAWTKTSAGVGSAPVVTANHATAPDGTATADRIQFAISSDVSTDRSIIRRAITTTTIGFMSVWLKSNTGADQEINLQPSGATKPAITITNEWQRFDFVGTVIGAANWGMELRGQNGGSGLTSDLLVWGFQVEDLPFASSYIPTTSAPVTRANDNVNLPVENNFITYENGNHSQCFTYKSKGDTGARQRIYTVLDTNYNSFSFTVFSNLIDGTLSYRDGDFSGVQSSPLGFNQERNVVVVSDGANLRMYVDGQSDGAAVNTETESVNIIANISIGTKGSSELLFGHIKDFRIYDFALNADEVEFLAGV